MWGKQLALDNGQKVHSQNKDPYQKICKWYNLKKGQYGQSCTPDRRYSRRAEATSEGQRAEAQLTKDG